MAIELKATVMEILKVNYYDVNILTVRYTVI